MDSLERPGDVAAEIEKLKQARDGALRAARSAVRDASRVNRILTVLNEPAPLEFLLEKILTTVSELFSSDVVVLVDPAGSGNYYPVASVGLPEGYTFEPSSRGIHCTIVQNVSCGNCSRPGNAPGKSCF